MEQSNNSSIWPVLGVLAFVAIIYNIFTDDVYVIRARPLKPEELEERMRVIHDKVTKDAEEQYEITARSGSPMDICVQAGLVKAVWLQAKNSFQYDKWVGIEKEACDNDGLNRDY